MTLGRILKPTIIRYRAFINSNVVANSIEEAESFFPDGSPLICCLAVRDFQKVIDQFVLSVHHRLRRKHREITINPHSLFIELIETGPSLIGY